MNYQDIKTLTFRDRARDVALDLLAWKENKFVGDVYLNKPKIQFLYFHHVFDDELEKLEILIKELSENNEFIPYSEAVDRILTNNIDKPYVSFSSDDGFLNNLNAVKVLNKYNIKSCFFVNPYSIGLSDEVKIKQFCRTRLNMPPIKFMSWDDVDQLLIDGHEIGSHTMNHIRISEEPFERVKKDIDTSVEILKSKIGKVEHFAYPYGRFSHFNQEAREYIFESGFKSCASAERGCHVTEASVNLNDLFIRRDLVIFDWKVKHIKYFMSENSRKAEHSKNYFKY